MCWSFEVSVGFAALQACTTSFIFYRAINSKDPYVRGQLYLMPLLVSIVMIEAVEAFLWLDEGLVSVELKATDEGGSTPCSSYNKYLTSSLFLFLLPIQPLSYIFPCRRVGDPRNWDLYRAPEFVAIVGLIMWYWYLWCVKDYSGLAEGEIPTYRLDIQRSGYKNFLNSETCSYIGRYSHLFWTYDTSDPQVAPTGSSTLITTGSTYFLMCYAVIYTRPLKFCGGIFLTMGVLYFFQWHWFNLSYESAGVWCWSGIICNIYHVIQPYFLPPTPEDYLHYKSTAAAAKLALDKKNGNEQQQQQKHQPAIKQKRHIATYRDDVQEEKKE